jgi:acetyltransferase-like isoleucine patch superfamily enzyme
MATGSRPTPSRATVAWRIMWTVVSLVAVQTIVCAISVAPVVLIWQWWLSLGGADRLARAALISLAIVPSYVLFAVCLTVVSPLVVRLVRWQTPADAEMRIADMDWALLRWVRYGASIHLARMFAGSLFRGTPLWTFHLRLHGARLGRRVYINSLSLSDYNLIECGDEVVIGGDVHLSGHTVESGVVKTGRVRIGGNVTIGLGSVIEIGVEVGANAQIGALSFVPKHTKLEGGRIYAGVPARPLDTVGAIARP